MERYLSATLKLGRLYGGLKDALRRLDGLEARADVDRSATGSRMDELETRLDAGGEEARGRLDSLETRLGDGDIPALAALRDSLDELRALGEGDGPDWAVALRGRLDDAEEALGELDRRAGEIESLRIELSEAVRSLRDALARQAGEQAGLSRAYSDLSRRLDLARDGAVPPPASPPERDGLEAMLDAFYARLEDRYRGSREEIARRLVKYLPDARAATARTGRPVLDLGCGRGEWLGLLREEGIEASGIDLNDVQLRDAKALGLDVRQGEAAAVLGGMADGSCGMITAHHLAEHLPFADLVWLTREALRVLAPGGVLLYETPNPANVVVGASSFHVDPTHRRPLPAPVLVTLLDTVGFHPVETRFLHPHPKQDELVGQERLDPEIAGLLFGPQDLAVLGTRPGPAG